MNLNNRIHKLSPELANQIAAGEVVERPASVLKELLENSIDAGSKRISIYIEQAGVKLIRVVDDGSGIHPEDLGLALSRHATSKVTSLNDVEAVKSLGFRGEALASIASVSHLQIDSKAIDQSQAFRARVWGEEAKLEVQPCAHPQGTSIYVEDLFYNTPVRRKFLRSEQTENLAIQNILKAIALSHYELGFKLFNNQRLVYNLPPVADKALATKRVAKLCGQAFLNQSCDFSAQASGLKLSGWLGNKDYSRSQTDIQYFYINGRYVRDKLLMHAVRQAYQGLLPEGRYPAYILYLELDPLAVDVNVHPTKHEVRFRDSRYIHQFLCSQLNRALLTEEQKSDHDDFEKIALSSAEFSAQIQNQKPMAVNAPKDSYGKSYGLAYERIAEPKPLRQIVNFSYARYILFYDQAILMLLDAKHALAAKLQQSWLHSLTQQQKIIASKLMFPYAFSATDLQVRFLESAANQTVLEKIGFSFSSTGPKQFMLRQIPQQLKDFPIDKWFEAFKESVTLSKHLDEKRCVAILAQSLANPQLLSTLSETQQQELIDFALQADDKSHLVKLDENRLQQLVKI